MQQRKDKPSSFSMDITLWQLLKVWFYLQIMGHQRKALSKGCVSWMSFKIKDNIHQWCHSEGKEHHYFRLELEIRYYTFCQILNSKMMLIFDKIMHIIQIHQKKKKLKTENPSKLNRIHQVGYEAKDVQMLKSLQQKYLKHFQIRWHHKKCVRRSGKQG